MLNVYLLRHGETQWNAEGNRYCGRTDLPLTTRGMAQAERVGGLLKKIDFDAVFSSPLQRAVHTAQIAGNHRDVIIDMRLIETDFGSWEGKTKEEFILENPELWTRWMDDPSNTKAGGNGETALQVLARVNGFYTEVLEEYPSGNLLVVGHNGINRLFLAHQLGMPLKHYRKFFLDNAAVTWFTMNTNGEFILKRLNGLG